ncbi:MAG: hypothetical protein AABX33_08750 [Nanoarchaeota archaeon]
MTLVHNLGDIENIVVRVRAQYKKNGKFKPRFGLNHDDRDRKRKSFIGRLQEQVSLFDLVEDVLATRDNGSQELKHTNDILCCFGFSDGEERARLLRSVSGNGDYSYAGENVRKAYVVARRYGLEGNYLDTPEATKNIFVALARSTHLNGFENTFLLARVFGFDRMSEIVAKGYYPIRVGRKVRLVGNKVLEHLARTLRPETVIPHFTIHPNFMEGLGYNRNLVNGLPVYR